MNSPESNELNTAEQSVEAALNILLDDLGKCSPRSFPGSLNENWSISGGLERALIRIKKEVPAFKGNTNAEIMELLELPAHPEADELSDLAREKLAALRQS